MCLGNVLYFNWIIEYIFKYLSNDFQWRSLILNHDSQVLLHRKI